MQNSIEVPPKLQIELSYDPRILDIYYLYIQKDWKEDFHNSQEVETTKILNNWWMDNIYIYMANTYNEVLYIFIN